MEIYDFEVVSINPPYDRNLHLKFLNLSVETSSHYVLSIEPSNWIIRPYKDTRLCKDEKLARENIEQYKTDVEIIQGRELFDAEIQPRLSINLIDKLANNTGITVTNNQSKPVTVKTYAKIDDISMYSDDDVVMSIRKKLELFINDYQNQDTLIKHVRLNRCAKVGLRDKENLYVDPEKEDVSNWYCVNLAIVRGNIEKDSGRQNEDFYTWLPAYRVPEKYDKDNKLCMVPFKTEDEANNFIDYLKGYFARFMMYLVKTDYNQNQCMYRLPWFDFTSKVTDEELFAMFNITEEEQGRIKELIPVYYGEGNKRGKKK